jgi:hypothetical protein
MSVRSVLQVKFDVMEKLVNEVQGFDFQLEFGQKLKHELQRARSIQERASDALNGPKRLTFANLRSLLNEGDKNKVQVDQIKALKKHQELARKWLVKVQKVRDEDFDTMCILARDAENIRVDFAEDMDRVRRAVERCCFCRRMVDGPMLQCVECQEQYHCRCLDVYEADVEPSWRCARCLVRRHYKNAVERVMEVIRQYLAVPRQPSLPPGPPADPLLADESLGLSVDTDEFGQPYGMEAQNSFDSYGVPNMHNVPGGGYPPSRGHDDVYMPRDSGMPGGYGRGPNPYQGGGTKAQAWMKRMLRAFKLCTQGGSTSVRMLGGLRTVKDSPVMDVLRISLSDPDLDTADTREVRLQIDRMVWSAQVLCQLRRRPSLARLQFLAETLRKLGIHDMPLQSMLEGFLGRTIAWVRKTRPIVLEVRGSFTPKHTTHMDRSTYDLALVCQAYHDKEKQLDLTRLTAMMEEKRHIPVSTLLERRIESMLYDEVPGKRYCICRGFSDGTFMLECSSCGEWFHGRCIQIREGEFNAKVQYHCRNCCLSRDQRYLWPPYVPPNLDLLFNELEDEFAEEEPIDDEKLDERKSLVGLWPSMGEMDELDAASQHIDSSLNVFSVKRKKGPGGSMSGPTNLAKASYLRMGRVGGGGGGGGGGTNGIYGPGFPMPAPMPMGGYNTGGHMGGHMGGPMGMHDVPIVPKKKPKAPKPQPPNFGVPLLPPTAPHVHPPMSASPMFEPPHPHRPRMSAKAQQIQRELMQHEQLQALHTPAPLPSYPPATEQHYPSVPAAPTPLPPHMPGPSGSSSPQRTGQPPKRKLNQVANWGPAGMDGYDSSDPSALPAEEDEEGLDAQEVMPGGEQQSDQPIGKRARVRKTRDDDDFVYEAKRGGRSGGSSASSSTAEGGQKENKPRKPPGDRKGSRGKADMRHSQSPGMEPMENGFDMLEAPESDSGFLEDTDSLMSGMPLQSEMDLVGWGAEVAPIQTSSGRTVRRR